MSRKFADGERRQGRGIAPLISTLIGRGIGTERIITFTHRGGIFTYGERARLSSPAD